MSRYGIDDPGEHTHWDHLEEFVTKEQFSWLWKSKAAEMVFGRLDLIYPGAANVVNALCNEHEVHFVTHRNPYAVAGVTGRWLNYHFRNYTGVHVLNNRCKKWELGKWDVFIDDKVETVEGFVEHTRALVLMPDRPWNQETKVYRPDVVFKHWVYLPARIAEVSE